MKNPKEAINEIKKLMIQFGFLQEKEETKKLSFKLEDDTIVQIEKLEAGNKISKINEAFEEVALEDGTYKIETFNVEVAEGEIKSVQNRFMDVKLSDGTVLNIEGEQLTTGAKVMVVTEEGMIPAPDGQYETEDGVKFSVEGSEVVGIEEPTVEPEAEPEVEDDFNNEMAEMLKGFIENINERISAIESKFSEFNNDFEQFKKEPATKKISDGKTDFNKEITTEDARVKAIMNLRRK